MAKASETNTDIVTPANVKVSGDAPPMALGSLFQTASHSTGISMETAVNSVNQENILTQTGTTMSVPDIYSEGDVSDTVSISTMLDSE